MSAGFSGGAHLCEASGDVSVAHDIEGAHAVGIPVLAVASNTHTLDELASHRPWRVMRTLPGRPEFEALLAAGH